MPQANIFLPATFSGHSAPLVMDAQTGKALVISGGGVSTLLNVAAQTVVKATPGRVMRLSITTAGTAGSWAINDATTTGAVAASNLVWQALFSVAGAAQGSVVILDFPCLNGIVLSVPTGGVASVSFL